MTQGMDCEPTLSLAIPADRMLKDVTFAVLPRFDQMITVARPTSELIPFALALTEPVLLDGDAIPESLFRPAGGGFEVAQVAVPECPWSEEVCTHRLQGTFGVTLRGMDVVASYATTLPIWNCGSDPDSCPRP